MPVYNRRFQHQDTREPAPEHLQLVGPRIPVEVHVPREIAEALTKEEKPIPPGVSGFALVDTGASVMCVDRDVIQRLGVQPIGVANVGTAGGLQQQAVFPALLRFPDTTLPELNVFCLGADLTGQAEIIAFIYLEIALRTSTISPSPRRKRIAPMPPRRHSRANQPAVPFARPLGNSLSTIRESPRHRQKFFSVTVSR